VIVCGRSGTTRNGPCERFIRIDQKRLPERSLGGFRNVADWDGVAG
jgi:hypothetical protein